MRLSDILNTAHHGTVYPKEAWKIDKMKSKDMKGKSLEEIGTLVWRME